MSHTDKEYLSANPFEGDDVEVECHRVKLIVARTSHRCAGSFLGNKEHVIPAGQRVWRESAKVDGQFGTCYVCLPCLDVILDYGDDSEDD